MLDRRVDVDIRLERQQRVVEQALQLVSEIVQIPRSVTS
jgi:hypothetical protein